MPKGVVGTHTYRLDAQKDADFLLESRKDPVTLSDFQPGQEIVVCGNCRAVFLAGTWREIGGRCALCAGNGRTSSPTLALNTTKDLQVHMRLVRSADHFRMTSPNLQATLEHRRAVPPMPVARPPAQPIRHNVIAARRRDRVLRALRNTVVAAVVIVAMYGLVSFISGQLVVGAMDGFLQSNGMLQVKEYAANFQRIEQQLGLRDEIREVQNARARSAPIALSTLAVKDLTGANCGLYMDSWKSAQHTAPFQVNGRVYGTGLGWYVLSDACSADGYGSSRATFEIDRQYGEMRFDLGADQGWYYGDVEQYGMYRVTVEVYNGGDIIETWSCDWLDNTADLRDVRVDLHNARYLSITLEQQRGAMGTLNIVLGDVSLLP